MCSWIWYEVYKRLHKAPCVSLCNNITTRTSHHYSFTMDGTGYTLS
jgi:hypothetical protein